MRRKVRGKKEITPDVKFNSKVVAKFINIMMKKGKKSLAEHIIYDAFEKLKAKTNEPDALKIFYKALDNIRPHLEVKPRRVGGATYQIPLEVKQDRGVSIALRWIRDFARARKGKPMVEKLTEEIFAAYRGEGPCIKKRDDTHKMADANKAFAHFRW